MSAQLHLIRNLQKIWLCLFCLLIPACTSLAITEPVAFPPESGMSSPETQAVFLHTPSPMPTPSMQEATPHPTANTPALNPTIPGSANNSVYLGLRRKHLEIWEFAREVASFQMIYQGPPGFFLLGEGEEKGYLSPEAAAVLRENQELDPDPLIQSAEEIRLDNRLTGLTLSPGGEMLAWSELYENCPGNYCYGQHTLKVLSLAAHTVIAEIRTPERFSYEPVWSPDGRYLAYHEVIRGLDLVPPTLWVLDTFTGKTEMMGQGAYPVWSPEGKQIAALYTENPYSGILTEVRIYTLEDPTWITVQPPNWDEFESPAWSPDSSKLAFIARTIRHISEDQLLSGIYILDRQTKAWTEIYSSPPNYFLTKLQWFPDIEELAILRRGADSSRFYELGKISLSREEDFTFISTIINPEQFEWSFDNQWLAVTTAEYELMVFDVQTWTTLIHLEDIFGRDWQWSTSGHEILLLSEDFDSGVQILQVMSVPEGKLTTIPFPDEFEGFIYSFNPISITW